MSTERTDQYPEVSGDEAGIVPPQGAAKQEWPKKIRTLTANELDRLTIDGLGRFYWDGKLVNYEAHPSRIEQKPVDLDQHAMDLLDRTARELSDPNSARQAEESAASEIPTEAAPATSPASDLTASPSDQIVQDGQIAEPGQIATIETVTAAAPAVTPPTPVVEMRRQEILTPAAARPETVRVKLTPWQSIGLVFAILGLVAGAVGIALSGLIAVHEWGCKAGIMKSYCPVPPPAPQAPPRPDIPA